MPRIPRPLLPAALVLAAGIGMASATGAETLCTLVMDAQSAAILIEQGDCDTRVTPASTFKIPLAVMGYESGILEDAHAPLLSYRTGEPDWGGANWTRDTDPTDWLTYSVVWYSQRITAALRQHRLTGYAVAFDYGNADFSGDAGFDNGLERAWIASSLKVSPLEQARFLRALLSDTLPVTPRAMAQTRAIVEQRTVEGWTLHGKTGGAYPRRADRRFDYARGWGWYVGWAEMGNRKLIFVRLTQDDRRQKLSPGIRARDTFIGKWPELARSLQP